MPKDRTIPQKNRQDGLTGFGDVEKVQRTGAPATPTVYSGHKERDAPHTDARAEVSPVRTWPL